MFPPPSGIFRRVVFVYPGLTRRLYTRRYALFKGRGCGGRSLERAHSGFSVEAGEAPANFQAAWTAFYWGWWISWAPFVGVFIARISRGRTVREFCLGVLLVPTAISFLWFGVMGGSALWRELHGRGGLIPPDGVVSTDFALFDLLSDLPWATGISILTILLIVIFFVTSSDSGSLVIDMLSSGGKQEPPTATRVFWSLVEGAAAAALLVVGGMQALQTFSIVTALPFSVIMILGTVALGRRSAATMTRRSSRATACQRCVRTRTPSRHRSSSNRHATGPLITNGPVVM